MATSELSRLITRYGIISDQITSQELTALLIELQLVLTRSSAGSIVEFGCYCGTTSLYIRRLLDQHAWRGEFHVYDSFAGLPDKTPRDHSPVGEQFTPGELRAAKKDFIMNFKKAGLAPPSIHKAWFSDLALSDIPDNIHFAFLDGDYYESIRDSFALITPKLAKEAVIVVDDYMNEALPGAAVATDEWLRAHPARMRTTQSLAIIYS